MTEAKVIFHEMHRLLERRAVHVRVQTECGTAVKITKAEAGKYLNTLESRGVVPSFDCTEISPMRYLVIISKGDPGIYINT